MVQRPCIALQTGGPFKALGPVVQWSGNSVVRSATNARSADSLNLRPWRKFRGRHSASERRAKVRFGAKAQKPQGATARFRDVRSILMRTPLRELRLRLTPRLIKQVLKLVVRVNGDARTRSVDHHSQQRSMLNRRVDGADVVPWRFLVDLLPDQETP